MTATIIATRTTTATMTEMMITTFLSTLVDVLAIVDAEEVGSVVVGMAAHDLPSELTKYPKSQVKPMLTVPVVLATHWLFRGQATHDD